MKIKKGLISFIQSGGFSYFCFKTSEDFYKRICILNLRNFLKSLQKRVILIFASIFKHIRKKNHKHYLSLRCQMN